MKTKQQEIEILDQAIKSLGPNTYLGPWLSQIRDEVKSLITSDFFVEITLADAQKTSKAIVEAARNEAQDIRIKAEEAAAATQRDTDRAVESAYSALRAAIRQLDNR